MEYLSIYEVASKLNVSHTTIYNKLKNKEIYKDIKPFIKKSGNARNISIEGVEMLKKFIKNQENDLHESQEGTSSNPDIKPENNIIIHLESRIKELENDKEYLKAELEIKNKQIENSSRLLENSQILLRESQQKLLLLEAKPQEPKGFFARLFGK